MDFLRSPRLFAEMGRGRRTTRSRPTARPGFIARPLRQLIIPSRQPELAFERALGEYRIVIGIDGASDAPAAAEVAPVVEEPLSRDPDFFDLEHTLSAIAHISDSEVFEWMTLLDTMWLAAASLTEHNDPVVRAAGGGWMAGNTSAYAAPYDLRIMVRTRPFLDRVAHRPHLLMNQPRTRDLPDAMRNRGRLVESLAIVQHAINSEGEQLRRAGELSAPTRAGIEEPAASDSEEPTTFNAPLTTGLLATALGVDVDRPTVVNGTDITGMRMHNRDALVRFSKALRKLRLDFAGHMHKIHSEYHRGAGRGNSRPCVCARRLHPLWNRRRPAHEQILPLPTVADGLVALARQSAVLLLEDQRAQMRARRQAEEERRVHEMESQREEVREDAWREVLGTVMLNVL